MRRYGRRAALAATTAVLAVVSGGTALALVSASASGTGSGETISEPQPVRIWGTTTLAVAPRDPSDPPNLSGWFTNPNKFKVEVKSITVTITSLGPGTGPCSRTADFTVTNPVGPWVVPAADDDEDGYLDWTGGSISLADAPTRDQTGCLGRTLHLALNAQR